MKKALALIMFYVLGVATASCGGGSEAVMREVITEARPDGVDDPVVVYRIMSCIDDSEYWEEL